MNINQYDRIYSITSAPYEGRDYINVVYIEPPQKRTILFKYKAPLIVNINYWSIIRFIFELEPFYYKYLYLNSQFFYLSENDLRVKNDENLYLSNLPSNNVGDFDYYFCLGDLKRKHLNDISTIFTMVSTFWQSRFYDYNVNYPNSVIHKGAIIPLKDSYKKIHEIELSKKLYSRH